MKNIWPIFFYFFLCLSCNSDTSKSEQSMDDVHLEESSDRAHVDFDKHQYFDDLESSTLDSLIHIVNLSDRIIAYNWNGRNGNPANTAHYILDAYGVFDENLGKRVVLNQRQKSVLKNLLSDSTNFSGSASMCFIPHIAFVYYKDSSIIGQTNVCFLCSGIISIPKTSYDMSQKGLFDFKAFCQSLELEIIDDYDHLHH